MSKKQEIADFFANDNWSINESTPEHISNHFDNTWGANSLVEPNLTPVFHMGMCVGTTQDIIDGKIDPTDSSAWKP